MMRPQLLEDDSVSIDVLANDSDPEGVGLLVAILSPPANGTATVAADSTVTYIPDADYYGNDQFTYTASDGISGDTATVTITVTPVNDAPTLASGGDVTVDEDAGAVSLSWAGGILAGADNESSQTLTMTTTNDRPALFSSAPAVDLAGNLTFTPAPDSSGLAMVQVRLADDGGISSGGVDSVVATFTLTVTAVNDLPEITSADAAVAVEGAYFLYVAAAADVDGPSLSWIFPVRPGWLNAAGDSLFGTPDEGAGDTTFMVIADDSIDRDTLVVTLTVIPFNDAPLAVDDTLAGEEDSTIELAVLDNDSDPENALLKVIKVTGQPAHGSAEISADSLGIHYIPMADYFGPDTLSYSVTDGILLDTALVFITVTPVNDLPVITSADTTVAVEGTYFLYVAAAADVDGPTLTLTVDRLPHWLSVVADSVFGTPLEGDVDTSFRIIASDGFLSDTLIVVVTVAPVNDPPVITSALVVAAVEDALFTYVGMASDPEESALTWTFDQLPGWMTANIDSVYGYPREGAVDTSFRAVVSDGELTDTALVVVTVEAVNDAPVAVADTVTTPEDTELTIFPLNNDTDPDGDKLTITAMSQPTHGIVVIDPGDTTLTYTPALNYWGWDSLTYSVSDSNGGTDSSMIWVIVTPVNDPPQPFTLMTPIADSVLVVTAAMIGDSVQFVWESAFDPDGDTVKYFFLLTRQDAAGDSVGPVMTLDTSIYVHIDSLMVVDAIAGGATEIVNIWDVVADDGQESILSTAFNRTFTLRFSNELLALGDRLGIPLAFALHQNFPNPFNPTSTIRFDLPERVDLELVIYDLRGRTIVSLSNGAFPAGYYQVIWNGRDRFGRSVPSGLYIARLVTPTYTKSIKMVLLK